MNNFTEKMNNKQLWYSNPFFAFWRGYKMCLRVYASGVGDGEGTHISVYLHLMKGPYDDELEQSGHWPLRGMFKVELLDQLDDGKYTAFISLDRNAPNGCINRVIEEDLAIGFGNDIVSHEYILRSNYLENDSLYFMIAYHASEQNNEHVAPVTFKINNFTEKMKNKRLWYSDPFFAFLRGYKMCLAINAHEGEGTHVSFYLHLMKGPYDDELDQSGHWPLRGMFQVDLLGRLNDEKYTFFILFDSDTPRNCSDRVIDIDMAVGFGEESDILSHEYILQSNYLQHDSLYIMISYKKK